MAIEPDIHETAIVYPGTKLGDGVKVLEHAVVGKQPVSAVRDQLCRVDEVVGNDVRDEVIEVDPGPPRLDAPAAAAYLVAEGVRGGCVDFQQPVAVRPGAGAAAARLDPEQVVEHRHDIVVVQVPVTVADAQRDDGQPPCVGAAEHLDARIA